MQNALASLSERARASRRHKRGACFAVGLLGTQDSKDLPAYSQMMISDHAAATMYCPLLTNLNSERAKEPIVEQEANDLMFVLENLPEHRSEKLLRLHEVQFYMSKVNIFSFYSTIYQVRTSTQYRGQWGYWC